MSRQKIRLVDGRQHLGGAALERPVVDARDAQRALFPFARLRDIHAGCPVPDIPGGERIGAQAPPIPRRSPLPQSRSGRPPLEPSASESDTDSPILVLV